MFLIYKEEAEFNHWGSSDKFDNLSSSVISLFSTETVVGLSLSIVEGWWRWSCKFSQDQKAFWTEVSARPIWRQDNNATACKYLLASVSYLDALRRLVKLLNVFRFVNNTGIVQNLWHLINICWQEAAGFAQYHLNHQDSGYCTISCSTKSLWHQRCSSTLRYTLVGIANIVWLSTTVSLLLSWQ